MQPRKRPDLIVPIRDRRQGRRYLTLRNARNAFLVFAVLFLAITIRSELQPRHSETFGRLLERELPTVEPKAVEVVQEAPSPIPDQTVPDPMLLAPAQREQWLYGETGATAAASLEPLPAVAAQVPADAKSRMVIVGGPEGVALVEQKRQRQVLRGGFGRD